MTISMYQASLPTFIHAMNSLKDLLKKGEEFAEKKGIDPEVLINARLAPDMFSLLRQVFVVTDMSKGCAARLSGSEIPKYDDNEKSFADLHARIDKTIEYINGFTPEQIDGTEEKEIVLELPTLTLKFCGRDYLLYFVIPNVLFHLTTAYNILRHNGVELGKRDFLGNMPVK